MLSALCNMPFQDNMLREGLRALQRQLPDGWSVGAAKSTGLPFDAVVEVTGPDKLCGRVQIETKRHVEPRQVDALAAELRRTSESDPLVLVAPYLSASTRERLRDNQIGYIDLTGNIRIALSSPGLFIETRGADEDPSRRKRAARSIGGTKVGRIVRSLVDSKQPLGVRVLAERTKLDPGYVSRVLAFLDTEALVTRVGHGRLESVDWVALLRRWAKDAPLDERAELRTYLEPRGLPALVASLSKSKEKFALTGSLAATWLATAPSRLAMVWIEDAAEAAKRLGLRVADAGANVLLLEPRDEWVFDGAVERGAVLYTAPSQAAADLLTSPGRGPAEGEAMIEWMREHEEEWRRG